MLFGRVINLDSRPDRWQRMTQILAASKYSEVIQRHRAHKIDKSNVSSVLSRGARALFHQERKYHQTIHGVGAIGCSMSHIEIWKEFLESDSEFALVLEDDLQLDTELDSRLRYFLETRDWDIALLGWVGKLPAVDEKGYVICYPNSAGFAGSHAYMLTRHAAKLLLENALPLEMQIDFYIQTLASEKHLRVKPFKERIKQAFAGGSDVFSLCVACEMGYLYAAICLLVAVVLCISCAFTSCPGKK